MMHKRMMALTILMLTMAVSAGAATVFTATIDGAQAGTPSAATGTATLTLNDAGTQVAYEIVFSGLDGVEGAAHFHNAGPGMNGPVMHGLAVGSPKVGVWNVTPLDVVELQAGRVYVNIHTDIYATGEIRGNISFSSVSSEDATWSDIKNEYR